MIDNQLWNRVGFGIRERLRIEIKSAGALYLPAVELFENVLALGGQYSHEVLKNCFPNSF